MKSLVFTGKRMEVKGMCEALKELMKDELDAARQNGIERVNILAQRLIEANRTEDLLRSTTDKEYQEQLFQKFGI